MRRGGARAKKPAAAGRGKRKEAADDHSEPEERTPTKRGISQSPAAAGTKDKSKPAAGKKGKTGPPAVVVGVSWPFTFEITSGVLLWGHMQTVLEGAASRQFDSQAGPSNTGYHGGTILTSTHRFRAAARKGLWVATRAFIGSRMTGFVVHHADVSGSELLKRCAAVGISNGQHHADRTIVYVNRYDWSWLHGRREAVIEALAAHNPARGRDSDEDDESEEYAESLRGGRLFVLDGQHIDPMLSLLAQRRPSVERSFGVAEAKGATPFGACVVGEHTEYELGWLVYSGAKHADFGGADELVGLVYDSAYSALEGDVATMRVEEELRRIA